MAATFYLMMKEGFENGFYDRRYAGGGERSLSDGIDRRRTWLVEFDQLAYCFGGYNDLKSLFRQGTGDYYGIRV